MEISQRINFIIYKMNCNTPFKIKQSCNCTLTITDNSYELYNQDSLFNFGYLNTITVDIVTLNKTNGIQLAAIIFTTHEKDIHLNEINLPLGSDGFFNITHLILPTVDWYYKETQKEFNNLYKYKTIYLSDGKNIYIVNNKELTKIDPLQFITKNEFKNTTIIKNQEGVFLFCFLKKCYIDLCKQILNQLQTDKDNNNKNKIGQCENTDGDLKNLIFKRDFVWATINIIKLLIKDCNFIEAQKILEMIQNCNGICYHNENEFSQDTLETNYIENQSSGIIYNTGCGCGK